MTYSIVARDGETGAMGVAVQSHAFGTGRVVTWGEAGVGVVATQSLSRLDYGPEGLILMRLGISAPLALETLTRNDEGREVRQVAMLDAQGRVAAHTGSKCIKPAGHLVGDGFSVQANLMRNDTIWGAMDETYRASSGTLAERLLATLDAAEAAGGDIRGKQSAAILIVSGERGSQPWHGVQLDLRVDDHPDPLVELRRLYNFKRADSLIDEGTDLAMAGNASAAVEKVRAGLALLPDNVEFQFWSAAALFTAGVEDEALALFRSVFQREPFWIDLLPQLVTLNLLPDDPTQLDRIRGTRLK